ncbi:MAG: LptF/LptG family permease, partial [Flavobacteriales bacterium]|nr:LptF/LptG family permease [Flavobacteriales bacterium]
MKKLDWYIIKKFLGTFFFALALILLIVIVFDISEKIDDFLEHEVRIKSIIFDYYFNFIPYFGNLFSPLFIFISVIFFTSKMAGDTEIIAILNSGMSFKRLLKPFMISAVILGALSFILGNFIIPPSNSERIDFTNKYLKNKRYSRAKNIHMQILPGQYMYMESFN